MSDHFQVLGTNPNAAFTLKVHRGDGMALLGMDWRDRSRPPTSSASRSSTASPAARSSSRSEPDHVPDAAVERRTEPGFDALRADPEVPLGAFPFRPSCPASTAIGCGRRSCRDADDLLGDAQEVDVELRRETWPGLLNVAFTRGFVSSQAFVDEYESSRPDLDAAPGRRRRRARLRPDPPEGEGSPRRGWGSRPAARSWRCSTRPSPIRPPRSAWSPTTSTSRTSCDRLEQLGPGCGSSSTTAATRARRLGRDPGGDRLARGRTDHVRRQHMGNLQHNKTIVVEGAPGTSSSAARRTSRWRGLYVQANNALVLRGEKAARSSMRLRRRTGQRPVGGFGTTDSTAWRDSASPGSTRTFRSRRTPPRTLASRPSPTDIGPRRRASSTRSPSSTRRRRRPRRDHARDGEPEHLRLRHGGRRIGGIDLHRRTATSQPVSPRR